MFLKEIRLTNYRSISKANFEFSPTINAITGSNGAGKTNVLDAIHFLCLTKSYLNSSDRDCIPFEQEFLSLYGLFEHQNQHDEIVCNLKRDEKKVVKRNDKIYNKLSDHIGLYPAVMISPYDRDLITEGSEVRRKFLDSMIAQGNKDYLQDLIRYNKVLAQRNRLLKMAAENGRLDRETLAVFDFEFVQLAERIHQTRLNEVSKFQEHFQRYYRNISGKDETVSVEYSSPLLEGDFSEILAQSLQKDLALKHSSSGVHKDDLLFSIFGQPVKKFGSQGQQKSFLVGLKLAKMEALKLQSGRQPILLLDDIFDKLDDQRVGYLIQLVSENDFGQLFITDTHHQRTEDIISQIGVEYRMFKI